MALTKVKGHIIADDLALGGNPTTSTQSASDNSTKIATTAYVTTAVSNLVDGAPSTLNTLNEIAAALNDDAALNTTLTDSIATKLPLAGGTMTGSLIIAKDDNTFTVQSTNAGQASVDIKNTEGHFRLITDAGELKVYDQTDSSERFKIDTSGKVRIGATLGLNHLLNLQTASSSGLAQMEFRNTAAGTQIGMPANTNALSFFTADAERMRITSNGNLQMIAQTSSFASPGFTYHTNNYLYCRGGSAGLILSDDSGINTVQIIDGSSGYINFETGDGSSRMRIKSDGNVGIGTINPNSPLHVKTTDQSIQVRNTGNANVGLEIYRDSDGAKGASFAWGNGNANLEIKNYRNDGQSGGPYANIDFFTGGTDADSPDFNPTRRMRIQQTGEVGIGTDDPGEKLEVNGIIQIRRTGDHPAIRFMEDSNTRAYMGSGDWAVNGGAVDDFGISASSTGDLLFGTTAGVERARIDSSGTLLVGTSDGTGAGLEISKIHGVRSNVTNNVAFLFNRLSNDGPIGLFRKDGSTVGAIATNGGDLVIGSHNTCFRFDDSADDILPTDDAGLLVDNTLVLGASNARFKEIYLSNGINFSANANASGMSSEILDDYEEGTYDATISCASGSITLYTSYTALRYTKIGRQVHIHGKLAVNSVSSPTGATNLNLPFVISNDTNRSGQADNIMTGYFNGGAVTSGIYPIYGNMAESTSVCRLFIMVIPATHNLGDNYTAQGTDYHINFTYTTD